jgi:serine protease Do
MGRRRSPAHIANTEDLMSRLVKIAAITGGTMLLGLVTFCRPSESPAAIEKQWKIWSDSAPVAPAVGPDFQPARSFAPLVKRLQPSVVNIATSIEVQGHKSFRRNPGGGQRDSRDPMDDMFRHFFGDREGMDVPAQRRNSLGSGFIVNAEGYILTNNHVVEGATEINVRLTEPERELKAKIVGRDEKYDLALIKVDSKEPLPVALLGDSDLLEVGDWVIAIGSPFGLAHTVTAGIVSAKDRVIGAGPFDDFIQTDASINPGNSGGPLFDASGNVVGINTAIHAAAQGIGFAVPVNMAKQFIRDVLQKGRVSRGWLGVGIQELTPELAQGMGLGDRQGVIVSQVFPGSPAEKAGVRRGDVVISFAGKPIQDSAGLTRTVGLSETDRDYDLKVVRDGRDTILKVRVVERDEKGGAFERKDGLDSSDDSGSLQSNLGLELAPLTTKDTERLQLKRGQGVKVEDVDSEGAAANTGVRPGDVVMEVNRAPVGSPAEFADAVSKIKPGDSILLLLLRGQNFFYVVVKKPGPDQSGQNSEPPQRGRKGSPSR